MKNALDEKRKNQSEENTNISTLRFKIFSAVKKANVRMSV